MSRVVAAVLGAICISGLLFVEGGFNAAAGIGARSSASQRTIYLSPSGSDSNPCSQTRPCASFGRAYSVAAPGDTVSVGGGTYPTQTISYRLAKRQTAVCRWSETFGDGTSTAKDLSGCVKFVPAPGSRPVVAGNIVLGVPYVMIDGIASVAPPKDANAIWIGWTSIQGGSCNDYDVHDVIVRNSGANFLFVNGVRYTYVVGSDFGPVDAISSVVGGCAPGDGTNTNTTHIALDGNTFHDLIQTSGEQHLECIHWYDGSNAVIRNNKFLNCAQQDISFAGLFVTNPGYSNLLIENNVFDRTCSHQVMNTEGGVCGSNLPLVFNGCGAHAHGIVIRFNSFDPGTLPQFIET